MTDDYLFGLTDKASDTARLKALNKVDRALEAIREHRPTDEDGRGNDDGVNFGGDDFSSF